jgi:hypothetical protein
LVVFPSKRDFQPAFFSESERAFSSERANKGRKPMSATITNNFLITGMIRFLNKISLKQHDHIIKDAMHTSKKVFQRPIKAAHSLQAFCLQLATWPDEHIDAPEARNLLWCNEDHPSKPERLAKAISSPLAMP